MVPPSVNPTTVAVSRRCSSRARRDPRVGSPCVAVKDVRPDEFWCDHHIKGRPLYPGVLMIESTAQAASWLFRKQWPALGFLGFLRCDDTCFRGQVVPGDIFVILVEEIDASPRRFISKSQGFVRGKLVFESKITGMAI